MDQALKTYALQLWGEYVRQKRLHGKLNGPGGEATNVLQSELGSWLEYSPSAAKQAVSQIEHGRSWIPRAKFKTFLHVLNLDETIFRRLDYHFYADEFDQMIDLLTDLLQTEFGYTPHRPADLFQGEPAASPPVPMGDLTERLSKLKESYDAGLILDDEYNEARKRILEQFVEGI